MDTAHVDAVFQNSALPLLKNIDATIVTCSPSFPDVGLLFARANSFHALLSDHSLGQTAVH